MYTVFRVMADVENEIFKSAVLDFEQRQKGFERNLRCIAITCSICESDDWSEHIEEMAGFVNKCSDLLKLYSSQGIEFVFDIAIGKNAFKKYSVRCCKIDLATMSLFCDNKVAIEFSVYSANIG